MKLIFRLKGGRDSGHHGHAGRPGSVGGSVPARVISGPGVDIYSKGQFSTAALKLLHDAPCNVQTGWKYVDGWGWQNRQYDTVMDAKIVTISVADVSQDKKWRATRGVVGYFPNKFGCNEREEQRFDKWGKAFAWVDDYLKED